MKNHLTQNTANYFSRLAISLDKNQNDNWMKDLMEQGNNYKNKTEAIKLIENDMEDFLEYADHVEGKYI
jgi:hypothetical protein